MAVLDFVFKTVPNEPSSPFEDALFHLPRRHANELALAAAILPVSSSNLLAPVSNQVFASDASQERGAFCSCEAPSDCRQRNVAVRGLQRCQDRFCSLGPKDFFESVVVQRRRTGKLGRQSFQMPGLTMQMPRARK